MTIYEHRYEESDVPASDTDRDEGAGPAAAGGQAGREPGSARLWTPTKTAIVAAVAIGVAGIGGVAAANTGHLVPSGQPGGSPGGPVGAPGGFGGTGTGAAGGTGTTSGSTTTGSTTIGSTRSGSTTTAKTTGARTGVVGATRVSVVAVSTRASTASVVGVVTPARSRQPGPAPIARVVQHPLQTAAEVTGTRHESVEDDDSDV